jgi:hypothetical protein
MERRDQTGLGSKILGVTQEVKQSLTSTVKEYLTQGLDIV